MASLPSLSDWGFQRKPLELLSGRPCLTGSRGHALAVGFWGTFLTGVFVVEGDVVAGDSAGVVIAEEGCWGISGCVSCAEGEGGCALKAETTGALGSGGCAVSWLG